VAVPGELSAGRDRAPQLLFQTRWSRPGVQLARGTLFEERGAREPCVRGGVSRLPSLVFGWLSAGGSCGQPASFRAPFALFGGLAFTAPSSRPKPGNRELQVAHRHECAKLEVLVSLLNFGRQSHKLGSKLAGAFIRGREFMKQSPRIWHRDCGTACWA